MTEVQLEAVRPRRYPRGEQRKMPRRLGQKKKTVSEYRFVQRGRGKYLHSHHKGDLGSHGDDRERSDLEGKRKGGRPSFCGGNSGAREACAKSGSLPWRRSFGKLSPRSGPLKYERASRRRVGGNGGGGKKPA